MDKEIDETLYSRQMYVLGKDAMRAMSKSDVLICSLCGLGLEIAKNVILSGVKSVTLWDNKKLEKKDLTTHYYCDRINIGCNRANVSRNSLAELNSYVKVNVYDKELTEEYLKQFTIIVTTEYELNYLNNITHKLNIPFILTETKSVFGRVFCDFGKDFVVNDINGEKPRTSLILDISDDFIVKCIESQPHKLSTGDFVIIESIDGLENIKPCKIEVIDRFTFKLNIDVKPLGKYIKGGLMKQIKLKTKVSFKSFNESVKEPEIMMIDYLNFNRSNVLHQVFQMINENKEVEIDDLSEKDKIKVDKFILTKDGQTVVMNSVIGGIVAQEVLKACSGKFMPIKQWLYFESSDSLADVIPNDLKCNSRYSEQIKIFGKDFQDKLDKLNIFMVGTGAIGCELLKNLALSGVSCRGKLTITDMDIIEKSNLNRQFLFRNSNIGKSKSEIAKDAIKNMNNDINIISHENRVGLDSENIYNNKFYDELDCVINALDNVEARRYVDSRCVIFKKPLLESGTLGTKGNTQVILPFLTESYGSSQDPPEESIPLCTLKNFPNSINHTIEWAKDQFCELFTNGPLNVNNYIDNPNFLKSLTIGELKETVNSINIMSNFKTYNDCLNYAFKFWHEKYKFEILELHNKFPKDSKTKEGMLFWSGSKKYPNVLEFDLNNSYNYKYIQSFANLLADVFNIKHKNEEYIKNYINTLTKPEFILTNKHISVTDDEEKTRQKEINNITNISDIMKKLTKTKFVNKLNSLEFEKDNPDHIEFITASSNLRAINYQIEPISSYETKGIAGKIIPAIATTTAIVAGLSVLELFKIVHNHNELEKYRNTYLNLALPLISFSEPFPPKKYEFNKQKFTIWDNITINDMQLKELMIHISRKLNADVELITYETYTLYSWFISSRERNKRLQMTVSEIIEDITNNKLNKDSVVLSIDANPHDTEDYEEMDMDYEIPDVLVKLS